MHIQFNTSNSHKQSEISQFLNILGCEVSFTDIDLREPLADADSVIAVKVCQLPLRTLAEDSALFIEGCEEAGVSIKWFLDSLDKMLGRRVIFQVRVALRDDTEFGQKVMIWKGEISGTICVPKGNSKFGFDNVFVPDGQILPYSLHKPIELNPRFRALSAMVNGQNPKIIDPIFEWSGEWQGE